MYLVCLPIGVCPGEAVPGALLLPGAVTMGWGDRHPQMGSPRGQDA